MTDFLGSLKDDLLDRRLLPLVAIVLLALAGAVAYATLAGGSSPAPSAVTSAVHPLETGTSGIAVSAPAASATQAVAETTNGTAVQRRGVAHDPFIALAAPAKTPAGSSAGKSSGGAAQASGGSKSASSPSTSSTPQSSGTPKPSEPSPSKTVYKVAVLFGLLPAGVIPQNAELQAYTGLTGVTPLPSAKNEVVRFLGVTVTSKGTTASFELSGEVIIHGQGVCLPSSAQCKMIELAQGGAEQLEVLSNTGALITYELRVENISTGTASAAAVKHVLAEQARTARTLLADGGLLKLAGLHFAAQAGVLVFDARPARHAHAARAHAAVQRGRASR